MSEDEARYAITAFAKAHPAPLIRVIDNTKRIIPAAIDQAISTTQGGIIIRLDAHSIPAKDYIEQCQAALEETAAANVSRRWEIKPGGEGGVVAAGLIITVAPWVFL